MTTETARVEAFSDGVFAVAITLLILEIKVPGYEGDLGAKLLLQWPSYLAFVISFAFIGVMWINHHRLFTHIRKSDDMLLMLNLALMFSVCIVPFTTALLAAHIGHPGARTARWLTTRRTWESRSSLICCGDMPLRVTDTCWPPM